MIFGTDIRRNLTMTLKQLIISSMAKYPYGRKYLFIYSFLKHLKKIGWLRSAEMQLPVDIEGKPLPWYTYAAIYFIEKKITRSMNIFEYGSGNSTLWWSSRVSSVISIEHERSWFDKMKQRISSNVEYRYCELIDGGQYCKVVSEYEKRFDVIIIDGRDRINCVKNSLKALKDDGVIIWDNSDRDAYLEGYNYLLEKNFKRLDFYGYTPFSFCDSCTSIFYRTDNCFDI